MTAAPDRGPVRIESERLLLVEGPDDRHLLEALIHHWPGDAHPRRRRTVDAWAPLDGRVINGGLRMQFR